jgi:WD40 repeat protein
MRKRLTILILCLVAVAFLLLLFVWRGDAVVDRSAVFEGGVRCLDLAPGSPTIAVGTTKGEVALLDVRSWRTLRVFLVGFNVQCVAFSPEGNTLAVGGYSPVVRLFDLRTMSEKRSLIAASSWVFSLAFSRDGRLLACGSGGSDSEQGYVRVWDTESFEVISDLPPFRSWVYALAFTRHADELIVRPRMGSTEVWNARRAAIVTTLPISQLGTPVLAPASDRKIVAAVDWNVRENLARPFEIIIVDLERKQKRTLIANYDGRVASLAMSNANQLLAVSFVGNGSSEIRVYKTIDGSEVFRKTVPFEALSTAFVADSQFLVVGGARDNDGYVRLFSLSNP